MNFFSLLCAGDERATCAVDYINNPDEFQKAGLCIGRPAKRALLARGGNKSLESILVEKRAMVMIHSKTNVLIHFRGAHATESAPVRTNGATDGKTS